MRRLLPVPLTCLVLVACGGAPPPVETPPPPVVVVSTTPEVAAGPDLSAVSEPKGLLVLGRWSRPVKGIDQILKLFGLPDTLEARLIKEAGGIAPDLALDASVDLALSLDPESTDDDPKFLAAVSIPFKSFDAVKAFAGKDGPLTPVAGGAFRSAAGKSDKATCDLSPAAGDAPARVVCGGKARDVDTLRPWLTRGLPRVAAPADELTVTLRAAALKDRYLGLLRTRGAAFGDEARAALTAQGIHDPELLAAPGVVVDEGLHFLDDLEGIDLRASLRPAPAELTGAAVLRFRARSSWLTRAITEGNDKAGPPPALFWRAPRDAGSATWGQGGDPRTYDGIRRVLHKALGEGLARVPLLPDADQAALLGFVDGIPRPAGPWVTAQGTLPNKALLAAPKGAPVDVQALASVAIGWTITGVEAPAAEYVAWAKQGVDVYARALRIADAFLGPTGKGKGAKDTEDLRRLAPRVTVQTSPPGWPKGTVAIDALVNADLIASFADKKKAAKGDPKKPPTLKGSLTLRIAIVPDGDRTWIGFSANPGELKKRMNIVAGAAPPEATLAAREGLDELRAAGQTWGGFFNLGDVLENAVEGVEQAKPEAGPDARALLESLPNRGRTPVLLVGSGAVGDKPSMSAEVRLQAGTLADVVGLIKLLDSPRGRELLKRLDL